MKLSGLVFHPKASSCPRNQWQPRNGLTFLSRSCLRQISQNDPCTFQNFANYLNCCFCIEQSLIIKDRYYCSVKKNSAVTEKYQIFTLFSWIIVIVMVIIVLLRLLASLWRCSFSTSDLRYIDRYIHPIQPTFRFECSNQFYMKLGWSKMV